MAASTMSTSLLNTRTAVPTTRRFTSRPARAVRVFASGQERRDVGRNEGPKDAFLKTFGVLAAAQLAVLPFAGAALADIIPNKAERAEINEKTSNLPTFGQVGESLKKNLGGSGDPKDIGRAIDNNTPDVDLTKNPKDIGKDIKRGIENITPDLSEAPSPLDTAKEQKDQVIRQGGNVGQDLGSVLPNLGNPLDAAKNLADKAQNIGGGAAQKAKNTVSDLSDLPNPFQGNLANDAKNKAKGLGNEITKNVPTADDAKRLGNQIGKNVPTAGDAKQAAQKAKNSLSDLSDLPNPFSGDVKNKAKGLGNEITKNVPTADDAKRLGDKITKNVPTADDAKRLGDQVGKNVPTADDFKNGPSLPSLPNLGGGGSKGGIPRNS